MRIKKATPEERQAHHGVYPLYGSVQVDGMTVLVESLAGYDPEWKYEALAPDGYIFEEGTHTLLADTQADLFERLSMGLESDPELCA